MTITSHVDKVTDPVSNTLSDALCDPGDGPDLLLLELEPRVEDAKLELRDCLHPVHLFGGV